MGREAADGDTPRAEKGSSPGDKKDRAMDRVEVPVSEGTAGAVRATRGMFGGFGEREDSNGGGTPAIRGNTGAPQR